MLRDPKDELIANLLAPIQFAEDVPTFRSRLLVREYYLKDPYLDVFFRSSDPRDGNLALFRHDPTCSPEDYLVIGNTEPSAIALLVHPSPKLFEAIRRVVKES